MPVSMPNANSGPDAHANADADACVQCLCLMPFHTDITFLNIWYVYRSIVTVHSFVTIVHTYIHRLFNNVH